MPLCFHVAHFLSVLSVIVILVFNVKSFFLSLSFSLWLSFHFSCLFLSYCFRVIYNWTMFYNVSSCCMTKIYYLWATLLLLSSSSNLIYHYLHKTTHFTEHSIFFLVTQLVILLNIFTFINYNYMYNNSHKYIYS